MANDNIAWVDIETTGLKAARDTILEVALIITDKELNIIEETPPVVIHQSDEVIDGMDRWCTDQHGKSGLIDDCRESDLEMGEADELLSFVMTEYAGSGYGMNTKMPMGGNSVHFDRSFLAYHMPKFHNEFHYRNIDVSCIFELCKRWRPELIANTYTAHRALDDIRNSIKYMENYRAALFNK